MFAYPYRFDGFANALFVYTRSFEAPGYPYRFGGFANALLGYTPSLSLPLFKGKGTPPKGK